MNLLAGFEILSMPMVGFQQAIHRVVGVETFALPAAEHKLHVCWLQRVVYAQCFFRGGTTPCINLFRDSNVHAAPLCGSWLSCLTEPPHIGARATTKLLMPFLQ